MAVGKDLLQAAGLQYVYVYAWWCISACLTIRLHVRMYVNILPLSTYKFNPEPKLIISASIHFSIPISMSVFYTDINTYTTYVYRHFLYLYLYLYKYIHIYIHVYACI